MFDCFPHMIFYLHEGYHRQQRREREREGHYACIAGERPTTYCGKSGGLLLLFLLFGHTHVRYPHLESIACSHHCEGKVIFMKFLLRLVLWYVTTSSVVQLQPRQIRKWDLLAEWQAQVLMCVPGAISSRLAECSRYGVYWPPDGKNDRIYKPV
jgi:hypothetical protein